MVPRADEHSISLGKRPTIWHVLLQLTCFEARRAHITRSVLTVLPLAKGELEGVLLSKQKNLPRPLLGGRAVFKVVFLKRLWHLLGSIQPWAPTDLCLARLGIAMTL